MFRLSYCISRRWPKIVDQTFLKILHWERRNGQNPPPHGFLLSLNLSCKYFRILWAEPLNANVAIVNNFILTRLVCWWFWLQINRDVVISYFQNQYSSPWLNPFPRKNERNFLSLPDPKTRKPMAYPNLKWLHTSMTNNTIRSVKSN